MSLGVRFRGTNTREFGIFWSTELFDIWIDRLQPLSLVSPSEELEGQRDEAARGRGVERVERMTDWRKDTYWRALKEDAPRLLNQIRQLGASEDEAKDLLQETLIRVLQARDRYDGRVPVGAFAFGFAVRVVANSRAGSVRRNRFLARYASEQRPTTSDPAARYEVAERVRLALERLSFNHRAVLVALDIERMTVPELALALGMNENTLYTRHREARAKFREALDAVDRGAG